MRSSPIVVSVRVAAAIATAPSTFGLPASSRSGRSAQAIGVGRDGAHRAASHVVGRVGERAPGADQRAGAVRRVQLVGRQGDEVEVTGIVVGPHVDRAVRSELGGVDEDATAGRVHLRGQLVHRLHDPGDVRRTRHGEQRDATGVLERGADRGGRRRACRPGRRRRGWCGIAPRHGRSFEWCSSIVVSTTESSSASQRSGEPVDRLGRVLGEHDHVAFGVGAEELADEVTGPLERGRAQPRLVAGAPMDARVERQELLDGLDHRSERRRARRVVEVHVRHEPAIEQRHQLIDPDRAVAGHQLAFIAHRGHEDCSEQIASKGTRFRRWRASVAVRRRW